MWIYIVIIAVIIIAAITAVIWHDIHNFVVRRYEVKTDKIKGDITFVLLADLHSYTYGKDNERLIKAIDEIKPDGILCAGDMMVGRNAKDSEDAFKPGAKLLKNMASKYPVYVANGNHEHNIKISTGTYGNLYDRYKSSLTRAGVTYLDNESALFSDKNIRITGLDIEQEYFRKVVKKKMDDDYLNRKLGELKAGDREKFQILIAHNPQYFPEYAKWGADLTVSGHVHGGIIRLPLIGGVISPALVLFPKYDGGKFEIDGKTMVLSRGLGTHTIHVRFYNPAEVSVINIKGV
jgi:predicted MPP superfamily phosphohydrolase